MTVVDFLAPHVLFRVVEYTNLGEFILGEAIASAELAESILPPAVEVAKLIDNMTKILPNCQRCEL